MSEGSIPKDVRYIQIVLETLLGAVIAVWSWIPNSKSLEKIRAPDAYREK